MISLPKFTPLRIAKNLSFLVSVVLTVVLFEGCTPNDTVAINILLAPASEMQNTAIELNERIAAHNPENFILNETQIPHITLLQAYVHERALPVIENELKDLAAIATGLRLKVDSLAYPKEEPSGFSMINIKKDVSLQQLHEEVIRRMQPFILTGGGQTAYASHPEGLPVDAFTLEYVPVFVQEHSFENYNPHISLGTADTALLRDLAKEVNAMPPFNISYLGVYQLGREGVAQKILWKQE